ncbi:MFS transporter small subunit [Vallicoccus soli]|uniref:MFS transporter small subunit n=1 Tax=Vallicoccus soli TaxID=2339232 RepID=UPI001403D09B|nr:hypothetical protein [Vallicoccus soli]
MSTSTSTRGTGGSPAPHGGGGTGRVVLAWAFVGIPLAYGISQTLNRASQLFTG